MPQRVKKDAEYYNDLLTKINDLICDANYRIAAVIVEGANDEKALRDFNLKRPVIRYSDSKLPTFAFIEELVSGYRSQTLLVLVDFDSEGEKIARRMSNDLETRGVRVERFLRKEFANIFRREGILRVEESRRIIKKARM